MKTLLTGFWIVMSILYVSGILHARVPSALIAEVVYMDDSIPPPPCDGLAFSSGEFHLHPDLYTAFQKGNLPGWVHTEPGLEYFEEVSRILMVRKEGNCTLYLSQLEPPPPSEALQSFKVDHWRFHSDGSITLIRGEGVKEVGSGRSLCIKSYSPKGIEGGCKVLLYNYGIMPTWVGEVKVKPAMAFIEDSVSGRFSGPGDRRAYTVPITKPGMLIVEYRSSSGPGSIDIGILDEDGKIRGSGGASYKRPQDVRVKLTYMGYGPSEFDAGFLFSPDTLLDCTMKIQRDGGLYRVIVNLENRGDEPIEVYRLGTGTVTWYADGVMIGGAHPGRPPEQVFLGPNDSLSYEGKIRFEGKTRLFEAKLDLPYMSEGLRCLDRSEERGE